MEHLGRIGPRRTGGDNAAFSFADVVGAGRGVDTKI